ncbi:MAG TPA: DUF4406 domain-containing protein [Ferruginibacter sp.]|nr:DUF4406 domain-containing protein [Ferruginibacter sp.]
MSTKKIYIAGKVTGLPLHKVSMKFGAHEKKLLTDGHTPIVPLNIVNKEDDWTTAMGKCIPALIQCDEVHMLPCWVDSEGAKLEHAIAKNMGIKIIYVRDQL